MLTRSLLLLAVVLSGAATIGAQAPAEQVVGGPFTVNVTSRSATVAWVVQTEQVSLGTDPATMTKTAPVLRAKKVEFNGLKPGTTYYYESFPGVGGKGSFKTPPIEPDAAFEFVVYGDTRTRHDVHRSVINAILKHAGPDFIVHTGDLVESGTDTSLWPIFFDAERELLRKTAFYPVLGNHDRNAPNFFDYLNAKPYYSFDWGGAHFSMINSDVGNVSASQAARDTFWQEQTRWLRDDLRRAANANLRFVVAHHPPITAVRRRQDNNPLMIALPPVLEEFKVTAAFFGHDHNYQHYLKNGIHYFTTGGGGAPLYDVDLPPADITLKAVSTENFVVVKVDGGRVHVEAWTPGGLVIEATDFGLVRQP